MSLDKLTTTRFGEVEYTSEDVVTVAGGVLGFPGACLYLVLQHREGSPFRWLQSIEEPGLAFLISDPANFISDYAPEISSAEAAELGLDENTPKLVYTIVTLPKGKPEAMTINLAGPIVINLETRIARQIVIEEGGYSVKHPIIIEKKPESSSQVAA